MVLIADKKADGYTTIRILKTTREILKLYENFPNEPIWKITERIILPKTQ